MPAQHPVTLRQDAEGFSEGPSFASNEMSLDSNQWNQTFKLDINQGEGYVLGRGQTRNPQQAEGFLGLHLRDDTGTTSEQITGRFRFTVRTAGSGRLVDILTEGDLEEYDSRDSSGNKKARDERTPFPLADDEWTTHQYDIWIELKPDTDDSIDTAPDSDQTEIFAEGFKLEKTN